MGAALGSVLEPAHAHDQGATVPIRLGLECRFDDLLLVQCLEVAGAMKFHAKLIQFLAYFDRIVSFAGPPVKVLNHDDFYLARPTVFEQTLQAFTITH